MKRIKKKYNTNIQAFLSPSRNPEILSGFHKFELKKKHNSVYLQNNHTYVKKIIMKKNEVISKLNKMEK